MFFNYLHNYGQDICCAKNYRKTITDHVMLIAMTLRHKTLHRNKQKKYALYKTVFVKITKISYRFFTSLLVHLLLHEIAIFRETVGRVFLKEKFSSNIAELLFIYKMYLIVMSYIRMKASKSCYDFEVLL